MLFIVTHFHGCNKTKLFVIFFAAEESEESEEDNKKKGSKGKGRKKYGRSKKGTVSMGAENIFSVWHFCLTKLVFHHISQNCSRGFLVRIECHRCDWRQARACTL